MGTLGAGRGWESLGTGVSVNYLTSQGMQDDFGVNWLDDCVSEVSTSFSILLCQHQSRQAGFLCAAPHLCKIRRISYVDTISLAQTSGFRNASNF